MITVFGSINVDYVFQVPSIPMPGETLLASELALLPGGKGGNQALAAQLAGAEVFMVGAVGDDGRGDIALAGLFKAGVNTTGVHATSKPTGTASIGVDSNGENSIVVFAGANEDASHSQLGSSHLHPDATLLMQMEVPLQEMAQAITAAKQAGARIIWNLAPMQSVGLDVLKNVNFLLVNQGELHHLCQDLGIDTNTSIKAQLANAAAQTGNCIVVTLGAQGCIAIWQGKHISLPALAIKPMDTVGAGDAFTGAFAAALDAGHEIEEALKWGSVAGALACLKSGAQTALPTQTEIAEQLSFYAKDC